MELAYVDKLSKDDRGIRYLLVHQGVFEKTIDVRGVKTKACNDVLRAFAQMITKRKGYEKSELTMEKNFLVNFKTFQTQIEYKFT